MKSLFSLLLVFLCVGLSCTKDTISIKGYTGTDGLGNIMGPVDPTDWTFDASWSDKETDVFSTIDPGNLSGTSTGTITIYPAFPNPCSNLFRVSLNSTTACKLRVAVVNKKLDKLFTTVISLNAGNNLFQVSTPSDTYKSGTLYRVYYAFDAEGSPMFKKGHGDIMIQ